MVATKVFLNENKVFKGLFWDGVWYLFNPIVRFEMNLIMWFVKPVCPSIYLFFSAQRRFCR
jgi:hypothetical protein